MQPKVGIALGGGGARGLAHIGVLQIFEEKNIPIDIIGGTSMGAIVGAMYAQHPDSAFIGYKLKQFLDSNDYKSLGLKNIIPGQHENPSVLSNFTRTIAERVILNIAASRTGILKKDRLKEAINSLLDAGNIQDTEIPLCVLATDLNSGEPLVFKQGDIRKAVYRSAALPGFIPPEAQDGKLITDGGVSHPVPVDFVREMGAQVVIGVSAAMRYLKKLKEPNVIDILSRMQSIKGLYLNHYQLQMADIALAPNLKNAHWSEFLRYQEFIKAGREEALVKVPAIRKRIRSKMSFWGRLFSK